MPELDLPAPLYQRLRRFAIERGTPIQEVVDQIFASLPEPPAPAPDRRASGMMRPQCPCCPDGCQHAFRFRGTLRCGCSKTTKETT